METDFDWDVLREGLQKYLRDSVKLQLDERNVALSQYRVHARYDIHNVSLPIDVGWYANDEYHQSLAVQLSSQLGHMMFIRPMGER